MSTETGSVKCGKLPGTSIGKLCERCDGKCIICGSFAPRQQILVKICTECDSESGNQTLCISCNNKKGKWGKRKSFILRFDSKYIRFISFLNFRRQLFCYILMFSYLYIYLVHVNFCYDLSFYYLFTCCAHISIRCIGCLLLPRMYIRGKGSRWLVSTQNVQN